MTAAVRSILKSIDRLPAKDQGELVAALLRKVNKIDFPPLSEKEIVALAEERFLELDAAEEANEKPTARRGLARRSRNGGQGSSRIGR
jgi:hypothetical protein